MNWIKGIIAKLIGKQVDGNVAGISRTKLIAIIGVVMVGLQTLPQAFGHAPVVIPEWMYKFLAASGLWTLRDAVKS